jgi:dihydrofolate reductase
MKITVVNHITLDGVMQAPAAPDEDPRSGFRYGGWTVPGNDEVMGKLLGERMAQRGSLLLGRRTYEHFYGFWPKQKNNPITEVLTNTQKYVASRTLKAPLPWENSTLLEGDAGEAVARLKQAGGKDATVLGSGDFLQTLMRRGLVDEWLLMIHPVVLGSGRRLFAEGSPAGRLEMVACKPTTTGVLIATYRPKEAIR